MPDFRKIAELLRGKVGSAATPQEQNSFLASQPPPSADFMRQLMGSMVTPAEMESMQANPAAEALNNPAGMSAPDMAARQQDMVANSPLGINQLLTSYFNR